MTQISKAHGIQRLTEKKQKERAILDYFLSVVGMDSSAEIIPGEEPDFIIKLAKTAHWSMVRKTGNCSNFCGGE